MFSLLFQDTNSNVQHVFQYASSTDLYKQLDKAVETGQILALDRIQIRAYYDAGHKHIVVNHRLHFEVTEL